MSVSLRKLAAILRPAGLRADALLTHLQRLLSSSAGAESLVTTLAFTFLFVHTRLQRILERQYERLALALATKASQSLLPGETVVATIEAPRTRLSEACASVKAASELFQDVWVFMRLWGLVGVYSLAQENYLKPPRDAILKTLTWGQVGAATVLLFMENCAYLASKGILRGERWEHRAVKWNVISARFWLTHTVLDGLRLLRVRQLRYNEDLGAQEEKEKETSGGGITARKGTVTVQSEALKKQWQRDFYAVAGWAPLTLHWSFADESQSPVSQTWLGLCGMVPGIVGLMNAWNETS